MSKYSKLQLKEMAEITLANRYTGSYFQLIMMCCIATSESAAWVKQRIREFVK